MKNKFFVVLIIGVFCGGLLVFLLDKGHLRFNYPSKDEFPVQGIDISHHQGTINWNELKSENISFVFIKATEGGDFRDPRFNENWDNAILSGYTVGAYHFYRLCKTGKEQAENFIQTVPKGKKMLPPAIDLELGGNCKTGKTQAQIVQEIQNYIDIVEKHYGQVPIIYATWDFYDSYLVGRFRACPIWIRDVYLRPNLPDNREFTFWQYANRYHLKGIDTFVDMNVFNGNESEFKKMLKD